MKKNLSKFRFKEVVKFSKCVYTTTAKVFPFILNQKTSSTRASQGMLCVGVAAQPEVFTQVEMGYQNHHTGFSP